MAGNTSFPDLYSVYTDEYLPGFSDNYTKHSKLLDFLKSKGSKRKDKGGVTITEGIEYAMNGQYVRYTGADSWGTLPSNPFLTRSQFLRRQIASTIVVTRTEELAKINTVTDEDEVARKVINAGKTLANGLAGDVYSDGSASNQIDGLQKIVADAAGTTVGGIDPTQPGNSFWENYRANIAAQDKLVPALEAAYIGTTRNNDRVDYIVMDNSLFSRYFAELQDQQRFVDTGKASGGFRELAFNGVPVVFDEGMTALKGQIPAKHAYLINSQYLSLRPHQDCEMIKREKVNSFNADCYSSAILWAGAVTTGGRCFHGVVVSA